MRTKFAAVALLALLAGCSGSRKADRDLDLDLLPERADEGAAPAFALPGVPLKSELDEAAPATAAPAASAAEPAAQAPAPAQSGPAPAAEELPGAVPEPAPAAAAQEDPGDLTFHLSAARRYAAKRKYLSAAAEYGAAGPFVPAGDPRAVHALERQGAMLLKAGRAEKARGLFLAAIDKAGELKVSNEDLANAYLGLGYCQETAKQVPEAVASYEKAREISRNARTRARLAKTIAALKKAR